MAPAVCSPAAGTGLPSESRPWPSANQVLTPRAALKVQVKFVEAPTARVEAPPEKLAQAPPPETLTPVRAELPVLVSVTTTVTSVPISTGPAGVWLAVISEVEAETPLTLPAACSPAAGTALLSES